MSERFLNTTQVAYRLALNMKTVQRMMAAGELQAIKIRGEWRMTESDLVRFMQQGGD
jgi:excisionase family DNA binding protein